MIVRRQRNGRFTIVANHIAEDDRLSYEAVGLMTYLLSRPDNWRVHVSQLQSRGGCGRDKTRKLLSELIEAGYVTREQTRSDDGRTITGVVYTVFDEPQKADQGPENPFPDTLETGSQAPDIQGPDNPSAYTRLTENNTDSHQTRVSADARGEGEPDPEAKAPGERAFKRAFAAWPTFVSDSEPAARKAWDALTAEERTAAIEREADYVASVKSSGRSKFCTFGVYLAEQRWQKLPPKVPRAPSDYAPPFGPVWSAWRTWHLMTVEPVEDAPSTEARWPLVQALHTKAKARQGHRFGERWHSPGIVSLMEAVPVGSPTWSAWEAEHVARGWPWLPDPGSMPVVYFPTGGPTRLEIFARMAGDDDGRAQAAE